MHPCRFVPQHGELVNVSKLLKQRPKIVFLKMAGYLPDKELNNAINVSGVGDHGVRFGGAISIGNMDAIAIHSGTVAVSIQAHVWQKHHTTTTQNNMAAHDATLSRGDLYCGFEIIALLG